mmetsp:Transcript_67702/g.198152  ORF Transcript_67702/g.198152 Transcript_67702/m.198152 type:complete len:235 (-) Transcript_67702:7-711(-)
MFSLKVDLLSILESVVLTCSCASPVRAASFVCRSVQETRTMSAGTTSPMKILTTSPTTSSLVETSSSFPERITRAFGADIFARASEASWAEYSPMVFARQTKHTMPIMTEDLTSSPTSQERQAAHNVKRKIMFFICVRRIPQKLSFSGGSRLLGPSSASRLAASSALRPCWPEASAKVPAVFLIMEGARGVFSVASREGGILEVQPEPPGRPRWGARPVKAAKASVPAKGAALH